MFCRVSYAYDKKRWSKSSLITSVYKTEICLIFGLQNQTGRIGSTILITQTQPEFTDCFSNKIIAKNNQQLSLDHVHTRTSSLHQRISARISAHTQMKLCNLGEGKHAVCAPRVFYPLAPVDLVHQQRRQSQTAAVQGRVVLVCVSVFGE